MLHPNLAVTRTQALVKERTLYCVGSIAPQVDLRVNNPDVGTLATALNERVFQCMVNGSLTPPPLASRKMVTKRLGTFAKLVGRFQSTPETYEAVVEKYKGRKKTIYQNALESLSRTNWNSVDAQLSAFVKAEKVPPGKAPRCIQPRTPRHCLAVGCFLKHIEHHLYDNIKAIFGDGPTVMKGFNVQKVGRICAGKWNSFRKPVAIGLDATKFDMHVCPAVLDWEHRIYLKIFAAYPELKRMLDAQMYNKGRGYCADGKVKYHFIGKRCSGDMNTALGNCLIMCGMVWSYAQERGVNIKLMNNGDDCVVFMEQEDLVKFTDHLEEWFLDLGFRMVAEEPVYDIEKIEFCQMHPLNTVNGWTMVRNIPIVLHKDSLCLVPLRNDKEMREWLGAIGECGNALTHGVPVVSSYYAMMRREGTLRTKFGESLLLHSGAKRLGEGIDRVEDTITPEARYGVWLAWGILPDHQVVLEAMYDKCHIDFTEDRVESYDLIPNPALL